MNNDNNKIWVLVIGALLILSMMALAVTLVIRQSAENAREALQPVNDLASNLGTQVSQVLHPTPTVLPDPVTIVSKVRTLARLETIQYSIEKVITAETGQELFGSLFGDRLLFVAHGVVIAGVDLEKLSPQDLQVQNGVLYVRLPVPEVFIATLDNDKSYVYNRETGLLTKGDVNLETAARRVAEDEIKRGAIEDGILDQARQNAKNYLERLLGSIGFPEVIFIEATPTP
jgi:hypothetical protein